MKRIIFASLIALVAIGLSSCDDGRIYKEVVFTSEGRVAKVEGNVTGLGSWAAGYTVAIAGFTEGDDYATVSRAIMADESGNVSMVLENIPDEVTSIQLCVLDRLRRHVLTLQEAEVEGVRDTIRINIAGTMNVGMYNAIQQSYFNTTCINCHGASNFTAAGLNLTEGKSYAALVGVPSAKVEDKLLVAPGDAENSVLHLVLNTELSSGWREYHLDLVSEKNAQSILPLIDRWIDNGANED